MGCHLYLSAHPSEHLAFQLERIGAYAMGVLQEMAGDIARGRAAKRESKAIAAHYRSEHRKMVARKVAGESGKVDFIGYF